MARKPSLPGTHTVLICQTERLRIRHFTEDDAAFILRLLNTPSFIRHIADFAIQAVRGVLDTAAKVHGLMRLIAVVNPDDAEAEIGQLAVNRLPSAQ